MQLAESMDLALGAIRSNKLRSFLTLLGIIIGVMTIIAMQSLITGLRKSMYEQLNILGSNVFSIQKFPAVGMGHGWWEKYRNRKDLTFEHAQLVRTRVPAAKSVSADVDTWGEEIRYKDKKTLSNVMVVGTTPEYLENNGYEISAGRFVTDQDLQYNRRVAVLGLDVLDKLFGSENPVGMDIKIRGERFEIIGVFEKKGSVFGNSMDNLVVIPFFTFEKIYGSFRSISISVQAVNAGLMEEAQEQAIGVLRAARKVPPGKENDFEVVTNNTLTDFFDNMTKYVRIVAVAIASISLLVAGVGIMNIMLVSVTERTKEIGIRKSIGAKRSDILWQFLIEAIVLSEVGGVIGIGVGLGIGYLVDAFTPVPAAVPIWTVFLGLLFCSFVGLLFGVYPASKAARLDPITALRYE